MKPHLFTKHTFIKQLFTKQPFIKKNCLTDSCLKNFYLTKESFSSHRASLLSRAFLSSSLLLCATASAQTSPTKASPLRASILQTQIVPYIQTENCDTQYQSSQEQLAVVEQELAVTQDELVTAQDQLATSQDQLATTQDQLSSTQDELTQAESEIQSLIDNCSSGDPDCASELESTQDLLLATRESYLDSLETIGSLEDELERAVNPDPSALPVVIDTVPLWASTDGKLLKDSNVSIIDSMIFGDLTGDVIGNLTGDVIGNISGGTLSGSTATVTGLSTGVVHSNGSGLLSSSLIVDGDITDGTITNAKLATVDSENTAGAIVARDMNGTFTATDITATGTMYGYFNGNFSGTVSIGDGTITNVKLATVSATNLPAYIVERDSVGTFTATTIYSDLVGSVTGNVIGNLTGDVTGNVFGNLAGSMVGTVTLLPGTLGVVHSAANGILSSSFITNADITDNTITGTKIIDNTLNGTKIIDGTITNAKLATAVSSTGIAGAIVALDSAGSFTATDITATGTIYGYFNGTVNIGDGTITNVKLATVSATNLPGYIVARDMNGTFTATTIYSDLVGSVTGNFTGDLIGNVTGDLTGSVIGAASDNVLKSGDTMSGNLFITSPASLVATVTGNVTGNLTGDVTGNVFGNLAGSMIGTVTLLPGTLGVVHSTANGVLSSSVITNADITDNTITGTKIIDNTLNGTKIIDGTITNAKLATAVSSTGIAGAIVALDSAGSFTATDITATGTIYGFFNGTVTIGDGTITNAKLATVSAENFAEYIVARDINGTFTATTIYSDLVGSVTGNFTGNLIGAASDNVLKAGDTMTGQLIIDRTPDTATSLQVDDGSLTTPAVAFSNSPNTGIYRAGSDVMGFVAGLNNEVMTTSPQGVTFAAGTLGTPSIHFSGDTLSGIYRPTPDSMGFVAGLNNEVMTTSPIGVTAEFANGLVNTPSISFLNEPLTGIYHPAEPNTIGFVTNGSERMSIDAVGTVTISALGTGVVHSTGGALSSSVITDADITDNTITGTKITDGTISNAKLATLIASVNTLGAIVARDMAGTFTATDITATGTIYGYFNIGDGTITDAKLAIISTAGKVANSATTATAEDTFDTIVARDLTGSFTATDITATGTIYGYFNGTVNIGDGTITYAKLTPAPTTANDPNTIVLRGGAGEFSAGTITANSFIGDLTGAASLNVPLTGGTMTGQLTIDRTPDTATSLQVDDGSLATPAVAFLNSSNTGIYNAGANSMGFVAGGFEGMRTSPTGVTAKFEEGSSGAPSISFQSDSNTGIYRYTAIPSTLSMGFVAANNEVMTIASNGAVFNKLIVMPGQDNPDNVLVSSNSSSFQRFTLTIRTGTEYLVNITSDPTVPIGTILMLSSYIQSPPPDPGDIVKYTLDTSTTYTMATDNNPKTAYSITVVKKTDGPTTWTLLSSSLPVTTLP